MRHLHTMPLCPETKSESSESTEQMSHTLPSMEQSQMHILQGLLRAAKFRDNETEQHLQRVSYYSWLIARGVGQSEDWCERIFRAAPLHDIGKVGISDSILHKPTCLTRLEREEMNRHVEYGVAILGEQRSPLFDMTREVILGHHEKWDGSGYPHGVAGEGIPLSARIVAIADVFDALTTERPYKSAWEFDDAIHYLMAEAGKHFDPNLVAIFLALAPQVKQNCEQQTIESYPTQDSYRVSFAV